MIFDLETHQLGRELTQAIEIFLGISPLNDDVFPRHVPQLAQPLPECLGAGRQSRRGGRTEEAYPGDVLCWLPLDCEWRGEQA